MDRDTQHKDKSLIDAALVNYESSPESAQKFVIKTKRKLIKSKGRNIVDYDYSKVQANIKQLLEIMKEIEVTDIKGLDNYTIYFGGDSITDTHEWTILTFSGSKKEGMLVTRNYIKYTFTSDADGHVMLTK